MTYKLLQREPTDKMTFIGQSMRYDSANSIGAIFRAMWDAAPSVEGCKPHPVTQVLTWADDYGREGGHALIVEMLRSYAALLAAPQPAQAQEPLDVERIIKLADQWFTFPSNSDAVINGGIGELIEFAHAVRGATPPQPAAPVSDKDAEDAARYRYLRTDAEMDAVIDAAMAQQAGKERE